jgi:CheY-like chemotaxis protein
MRLLLVEDHDDSRELVEMVLSAKGAQVVGVPTAAEALAALDGETFTLMLSDLNLPGQDGFSLLAAVRRHPHGSALPAIAVTGRADEAARAAAIAAGFSKVMVKPVDPFALVPAIVSIAAASRAPGDRSIEALIAEGDVRGALAKLNAGTPYRYTSVLRFDGERLSSVWSFDREAPTTDDFPLELPVAASYCRFIRDGGQPFTVSDASTDPRTVDHPKRGILNAYCGVPIRTNDGSLFGSLCHYDAAPQQPDASAELELERVAALLHPALAASATPTLASKH